MKSYDKILNRYGHFAKIYEALARIQPNRLYKCTPTACSWELWGWFIGILNRCTQNAVVFRLVAHQYEQPPNIDGTAIILYKLPSYKIEQMGLADLPKYVSAPCKTLLYDKLLTRKVKIVED